MQPWYMYPITVPFGDPNYDSALGGAHDLDIGAPPNYPVTALLPGFIASITAPAWGRQVGIKLDIPYNGVPYCAFLHLSAVSPALSVGKHVNIGDVIGWVGGANAASQYNGTSNPTGQNFLNPPFQSSRVQVGFALMRGPEYGTAGWENFPPVDWALNPTPIIEAARKAYAMPMNVNQRKAFEQEWTSIIPGLSPVTGIANAAWADYQAGNGHGPALSQEFTLDDWNSDKQYTAQVVTQGIYLWDGSAHYHPYH